MSEQLAGLFVFGFVAILSVTFFMLGVLLRDTFRSRSAAGRLGAEMSLEPPGTSRQALVWREGDHNGRRFAIRVMGIPTGETGEHARRWRIWLWVVVAIESDEVEELSALDVGHRPGHVLTGSDFDDVFVHSGAELLSAAARESMRSFVLDRGPKPSLLQGFLNTRPRSRSLRLAFRSDKNAWSTSLMDATVLSNSQALLAHFHGYPNLSPEALRALLDELGEVANTIEVDLGNRSLGSE